MAGWLGVAGRISSWIKYLIAGSYYINISKASSNIAYPLQQKRAPYHVLSNPSVLPNRLLNLSTNFSVTAYVSTFANPTNCVVA